MGESVRIQGSGGATFTIDLPDEGTNARELFDQKVAAGEITVMAAPSKPGKAKAEPASEEGDGDAADPT